MFLKVRVLQPLKIVCILVAIGVFVFGLNKAEILIASVETFQKWVVVLFFILFFIFTTLLFEKRIMKLLMAFVNIDRAHYYNQNIIEEPHKIKKGGRKRNKKIK